MSNDAIKRFGVTYPYSQFLGIGVERIEKLINRFGLENVERALEKRNNNGNNGCGGFKNRNPYADEWKKLEKLERQRQFA